MNNLQASSSANLKVLSENELTLVVGGHGHHRKWGGDQHSDGRGRNASHGNSRGSSARIVIIKKTIIINNTIINNTTFL